MGQGRALGRADNDEWMMSFFSDSITTDIDAIAGLKSSPRFLTSAGMAQRAPVIPNSIAQMFRHLDRGRMNWVKVEVDL
jgi:hypothetical protein